MKRDDKIIINNMSANELEKYGQEKRAELRLLEIQCRAKQG